MASQPALTYAVLRTGLPAAPVGQNVDAEAVFRNIVLTPPSAQPGSGGGPRVLDLLSNLAQAMVDDLVELGREWRADLVVFDPTAFAGPLAAAKLGIPAVRHLYGTDLMSVVGRFVTGALGPLSEKLGLDGVDPFGVGTVDPCPGGLQVPTASRRLPMRYIPYNGPGLAPPRLPERSGRPRVCISWGTTMGRLDPGLFLAGDVARAIDGLDVDVVVASTRGQRELLGTLPDGVDVVESAPLHLLLPQCDLMVAHGGAGTLLTALSQGLPQLLVPRLPDHVRHSGRLAEAGAGVVLPAPVDGPEPIRERLAELLAGPGYRESAQRLQEEMRRQPAPAQVVGELESIAAGAPAT